MGRLKAAAPERLAPWGLIAFCTLWRLPGLGDPPWLNDEGVYAMVGRALLHGEKLYRQVWENKPPAIYLLNAGVERLGGAEHVITGMRLLAVLASMVALTAVYRLMLAQRGAGAARLVIVLAGIGLDLPLIDGTEANAEVFVAAASAVGMALVWSVMNHHEHAPRRFFPDWMALLFAGAAFGVGIAFKLPAGADALAAGAVLICQGKRVPSLAWLLLGALIPLGAIVGWLAGQGLIGDALYATIGYNRGYVSTGQGLHSPLVGAVTILAPLTVLSVGGALAWRDRRHGLPFSAGVAWWLGLALIGALASGRTYPHYFLQAVVPAAICLVLLLEGIQARRPPRAPPLDRGYSRYSRLGLGLVAAWAVLVPLTSFAALRLGGAQAAPGSDTLAYYAYFWQHWTGGLDDVAYGNRIDPRVERNLTIANYLKDHPRSPNQLYVWGNAPWIYYLSGYEHATRFLSAFYLPVVPGSGAGVLPELSRHPPPYIVLIQPPNPATARLAPFLSSRYRPVFQVENAVIYGLHP